MRAHFCGAICLVGLTEDHMKDAAQSDKLTVGYGTVEVRPFTLNYPSVNGGGDSTTPYRL